MENKQNFSIGNHTHVGMKRATNQDRFRSSQKEESSIYIVSDGMGGHNGGETAAQITVDTICKYFDDDDNSIQLQCQTNWSYHITVPRLAAWDEKSLKGLKWDISMKEVTKEEANQ